MLDLFKVSTHIPIDLTHMYDASGPEKKGEDPDVTLQRRIREEKPIVFIENRMRLEQGVMASEKARFEFLAEEEKKQARQQEIDRLLKEVQSLQEQLQKALQKPQESQTPDQGTAAARELLERLTRETVCPHCGKGFE